MIMFPEFRVKKNLHYPQAGLSFSHVGHWKNIFGEGVSLYKQFDLKDNAVKFLAPCKMQCSILKIRKMGKEQVHTPLFTFSKCTWDSSKSLGNISFYSLPGINSSFFISNTSFLASFIPFPWINGNHAGITGNVMALWNTLVLNQHCYSCFCSSPMPFI